MSDSVQARLLAVDAIRSVIDEQQSLSDFFRKENGLPARDRAFASHLAYGTLRWHVALEWLAKQLLSRPLKQRDMDVQALILTALFQLWREQGHEHAAVHASVECTRVLNKAWASGLVNAVLRRFLRERNTLLETLDQQTERYAHPDWMLERLRRDWPLMWQEIAAANNEQAPLWLRINRSRTSNSAAADLLREAGFEVRTHLQAPEAIAVQPAAPVQQLPGFADGLFSVQDPAAQLAARYLAPEPGLSVLDACAAPGGKTSHLLELEPGIELLALDRDPQRTGLIHENLKRLGLSCQVRCADAAEPSGWWDGKLFDRILLDAPCSATGVIRRHPEIKLLRSESQVARAVEDQQRLLHALWPLLNTGGILVYATCSVFKEENHEQIHEFLARYPEASLAGPEAGDGTGRQILPGEDEMDGFYYARIRKSD